MRKFFKFIVQHIKPYRWYAVLNIVFNMIGILFSLFSLAMVIPFMGVLFKTQPRVTELVAFEFNVDSVQKIFYYYLSLIIEKQGESSALVLVSILVVIMFFLKAFFWYFANFFMAPLRNGIVRDIRNRIYVKILKLPLSYFSDSRKGDIISRMTGDVQEIEWSIMSSLEMAFREPINIIFFISALFVMSPELTMFVFVLLPIGGLIIGRVGKSLRKHSMTGQTKMGELMSTIEETLSGSRIVKAFNGQKQMQDKFFSQNQEYTKVSNIVMRRRYLASPMSEFLGAIIIVIVMWYGGKLVLNHESALSPQGFIAYLAIFSQIINPAKAFSTAYYNIQKGMASADRVNFILDADIAIMDTPDAKPIKEFKDCIEYKNVSFSYVEDLVLKDVNLKIEKGKSVALVGQSGSGKSTFVDLLPRFYDVSSGEIWVDGQNIKDYKLHDLRGLMGNVNQVPFLFNDTIYNNIAFGMEGEVTQQQVEDAAKVANAHEFILNTPNGYHSNIGDAGCKLSGGQRQRISIARAVLKNPPILILDEATSALDTESERLVQDALTNLMQNRTSIIIAHRLSTVRHVDEICVLHEGKIVERGKHDELINQNGVYKKLCDLQMFA